MLPPLGSLPNSLDSVLAYPLDDFFVSPFNTFKTVPKYSMEPYASSMTRIMKHLVNALESGGVDRERRLAIAIRWYAAAPQLFFRNPRISVERNGPPRTFQAVLERRLCSFSRTVATRLR